MLPAAISDFYQNIWNVIYFELRNGRVLKMHEATRSKLQAIKPEKNPGLGSNPIQSWILLGYW